MPLRFRQRFKILPGIYLNLVKNGISTTIGPRGANINIGKQGVYLNTGIPGTGISNRQNLLGGKEKLNFNQPIDTTPIILTDENSNIDSTQQIITSVGLKGLKEHLEESKDQRQSLASEIKDIENILSELQSDLSEKQKGFFSLFTKKETVENLENNINETTQSIADLKKEYEESKANIDIQFDAEIQGQYKKLSFAFSELINSKTIWDITTETINTEIKSSANSIVERKEVKFKWDTIDFIKSDHSAFHLQNANGSNLFIYPAFVLLMDKQDEITLIDLKELKFNFLEQRFNERKETLPSDSKIVDYTWYKVNKDNSRDLRFVGNFQIPVVNYGAIKFSYVSSNINLTEGNSIVHSLLGSLQVDGLTKFSNCLNETYYISNVDVTRNFANEFEKYLGLLRGDGLMTLDNSEIFSKKYFDLLLDFSDNVNIVVRKLESNPKLLDKLKDVVEGMSVVDFVQFCVFYDFYQILKIVGKEKGSVNPNSLGAFGFLLISPKIIQKLSAASLEMNYETLKIMFSTGIQKDPVESMIKLADIPNPLKISIQDNTKESSPKILGNALSITTALKLISDPLFDEYATILYRFANIIAKADNSISKEEENVLKEIYQFTHNPLSDEENKSLNISKVNEKETIAEILNELETLVGLNAVKQEVKSLINYITIQKEREKVGLKSSQVSYHCVFTGSPGTGKTTIARIIAKIYMHLGILKKGQLVETDRSGLVAEYLGQTAVKVNKTIDEAYSLVGEHKDDFGKEAVATLIKRMEDDRDKLIVILAGYTYEMKTFIDSNPGFKSRFNRYIEFADYPPSELGAIFKLNCSKLDYILTADAEKKLLQVITTTFNNRDKSFGNGRYARNLFEKSLERQANRIASVPSLTKDILITITEDDIPNE